MQVGDGISILGLLQSWWGKNRVAAAERLIKVKPEIYLAVTNSINDPASEIISQAAKRTIAVLMSSSFDRPAKKRWLESLLPSCERNHEFIRQCVKAVLVRCGDVSSLTEILVTAEPAYSPQESEVKEFITELEKQFWIVYTNESNSHLSNALLHSLVLSLKREDVAPAMALIGLSGPADVDFLDRTEDAESQTQSSAPPKTPQSLEEAILLAEQIIIDGEYELLRASSRLYIVEKKDYPQYQWNRFKFLYNSDAVSAVGDFRGEDTRVTHAFESFALGDPTRLAEVLDEYCDTVSGSKKFKSCFACGQLFLITGDFRRAHRRLTEAYELNPTSPEVWAYLAQARFQAGDKPGATELCLKSISWMIQPFKEGIAPSHIHLKRLLNILNISLEGISSKDQKDDLLACFHAIRPHVPLSLPEAWVGVDLVLIREYCMFLNNFANLGGQIEYLHETIALRNSVNNSLGIAGFVSLSFVKMLVHSQNELAIYLAQRSNIEASNDAHMKAVELSTQFLDMSQFCGLLADEARFYFAETRLSAGASIRQTNLSASIVFTEMGYAARHPLVNDQSRANDPMARRFFEQASRACYESSLGYMLLNCSSLALGRAEEAVRIREMLLGSQPGEKTSSFELIRLAKYRLQLSRVYLGLNNEAASSHWHEKALAAFQTLKARNLPNITREYNHVTLEQEFRDHAEAINAYRASHTRS